VVLVLCVFWIKCVCSAEHVLLVVSGIVIFQDIRQDYDRKSIYLPVYNVEQLLHALLLCFASRWCIHYLTESKASSRNMRDETTDCAA